MMLRFLGRGSAFADEHNCAYFTAGDDLVLLDCPMSAFTKLKQKDLKAYENIYVLITHTHGDHIGGVAMLICALRLSLEGDGRRAVGTGGKRPEILAFESRRMRR